jgi:hypothetical protein
MSHALVPYRITSCLTYSLSIVHLCTCFEILMQSELVAHTELKLFCCSELEITGKLDTPEGTCQQKLCMNPIIPVMV